MRKLHGISRWVYGDVPNGDGSYGYIECLCGWTSQDMYEESADPESEYKAHLEDEVGPA